MSARLISTDLIAFLRSGTHFQLETFQTAKHYKVSFREDIPPANCFIPPYINALVGMDAGSGFSVIKGDQILSYQYMYLKTCMVTGSGYSSCEIDIADWKLTFTGRHLDRLCDLVTERCLRKLFLVNKFEEKSTDVGPKDMTWISSFNAIPVEE